MVFLELSLILLHFEIELSLWFRVLDLPLLNILNVEFMFFTISMNLGLILMFLKIFLLRLACLFCVDIDIKNPNLFKYYNLQLLLNIWIYSINILWYLKIILSNIFKCFNPYYFNLFMFKVLYKYLNLISLFANYNLKYNKF